MDDDDELDWGDDGPPSPDRFGRPADYYTGAARNRRYDDRRRQRGQVRVSVWVPADRASELREIASKMRG